MNLKMEVYTPDLSLIGVLEIFNAVLWDRKAFSSGSFSIDSLITDESRTLLVPENIIWIDGDTAGIIEHIDQQAGEEGPYITAKGRDLTGILDRRILWGQYDMSGTVPDIMRQLVDDCCIHPSRGDVVENRVIPGLVLESASSAGGVSVRVQKTGGTLLEALEELGEAFQTSFGVRFNPEVPQMEFWTRPGINRSVGQNVNEPVFYSTELDDVLSSEYTYDSSNFRCVALVAGEGEGNDRSMVTVVNEIEEPPKPPEPPETEKYTITLAVEPEGGGTVTGGGQFDAGRSVTVRVAASSGYAFAGWQENGETVSTEEAYTFQVRGDRTLTAVFFMEIPVYTISASIDPAGSGTVTGAGQYQEGETVTLTASPEEGYQFSAWKEAGQTVSEDETYTFTAASNRTLVAAFVERVSRLPEGYTELEYIQSDGNCYIDTNVKPRPDAGSANTTANSDTKIVVDAEPIDAPTSSSKYIVYASSSATTSTGAINYYRFQIYWKTTAGACIKLAKKENKPVTDTSLRRMSLELDGMSGTCSVDGASATFTDRSLAYNASTIKLFGSTTASERIRAKMYSCKIYKGQGLPLVRELVPCMDLSGAVGLYDLVNNQFYKNNGTGAFIAGPAV